MSEIQQRRAAPAVPAFQPYVQKIAVPYRYRQALRARVRLLRERGEIDARPDRVRYTREYNEQGERQSVAWVVRLKPDRAPMPVPLKVAAWAAGAMFALAALAGALWHARYVLLAIAGGLLVLVSLAVFLPVGGHRAGCAGIVTHCSGCKG